MLKSVFSSIHTRNLKKQFGAVFEKMLKIPGGLHIKYPQILKNLFQNHKASTRIRSTGDINFEENRPNGLGASVDHRRTDGQTNRRTDERTDRRTDGRNGVNRFLSIKKQQIMDFDHTTC